MRTVELFAGVGGFRVGLNRVEFVDGEVKEDDFFDFVWANQFEPKRKKQVAYNIYKERFGECDNRDICTVDKSDIPDYDLLVAGFPCQDFSVINRCWDGIQGKTGVLWWEIYETLKEKMPKYGLFENVDIKEVKSEDIPDCDVVIGGFPCQGFSICNTKRSMSDERNYLYLEMLRIIKDKQPKVFVCENVKGLLSMEKGKVIDMICNDFRDIGYDVDYKVLKASDYGVPQMRERVIIIGNNIGVENQFPSPKCE